MFYISFFTEHLFNSFKHGYQICLKIPSYRWCFYFSQVGVLYVGRGQANSEVDILRNTVGSLRYTEFLQVC